MPSFEQRMLNSTQDAPRIEGQWSVGQTLAGRFVVRRFIGAGPLGEVYAVAEEGTGELRALRMVNPELAVQPPLVQAYTEGANKAGGLTGDGIVETMAYLKDPLCSATELVEGPSLGDYIAEYGALPFDMAIDLFLSLSGILLPLHERGIYHGSLSPAAILLERQGDRLLPRVKGFEQTPVFEVQPDLASHLKPYRAPELDSGGADPALADIFAFGGCLYETITGRQPTPEEIPKLQQRVPGLSDELNAVVQQCCQWEPGKRFQTLVAVQNILRSLHQEGAVSGQAPERPESGDVVANQYVVESMLGEGGMARVYLATDRVMGTQVALKLLNATCLSEPPVVERFLAEASIQARLVHPEPHPNIVAVHRVLHEEPVGFVMEYVDGFTLEDLLENPDKYCPKLGVEALSEAVLVDIFAQTAAGLHHAHKNRVVHRDLKPSNILLSRQDDGSISAKLMDFGISKQLDQPKTRTNLVLGTLGYIAPELFVSAKDASPASDIYALGCCMFEALVGDMPFSVSGGLRSLAFRVYNEPAPRPSERGANVSPELEALILLALEKAPEKRPESAAWLRDRLLALRKGADDRELAAVVARSSMGSAETLPGDASPLSQTTSPGLSSDPTTVPSAGKQKNTLPLALIVLAALLAVGAVLFFVLQSEEEPQADAAEDTQASEKPAEKEKTKETEPKETEKPEDGRGVLPASVVLGADELLAQARQEAEAGNKRKAIELYEQAMEERKKAGDTEVAPETLEEVADLYIDVADEETAENDDEETAEERAQLLASASVYMGRAAEAKKDFTLFMKKAEIDQERGDASGAASALQNAIQVAEEDQAKEEAEEQLERLEKAYAEGSDEDEDDDDERKSRIPMGPLPPNMVEVWIESRPDGARVYLGRKRLGRTPLIKRFPKTTDEIKFVLKHPSRYDETVRVSGSTGGKVNVRMSYRPKKID